MPELTIVIGGNGAGKSTWCEAHPRTTSRSILRRGFDSPRTRGLEQPRTAAGSPQRRRRQIRHHLQNNESFGFESTYSGRSRPEIVQAAAARGYEIEAIFVGTNRPEINIERVRNRSASRTGHDVPAGEVTRRWHAAQANLAATARYITTVELLENTREIRRVTTLTRNRRQTPSKPMPRWAGNLVKKILDADPRLRDRRGRRHRRRTSVPPPRPPSGAAAFPARRAPRQTTAEENRSG